MVFLGRGLLLRRCATRGVLSLTQATGPGVEFLKLYHAPGLEGFRTTRMGHLLLGHSFSWLILIAYTLGGFLGGCSGRGRGPSGASPSGAEPDRFDHLSNTHL